MGITATDPSGLADTTTYYFKVNGTEYDITTGTTPTYEDVATLIDTALDGAGFGAKIVPAVGESGSDIRLYNDAVRGSGSSAVLEQGDSSPDLFSNLNFWSSFRKPMVRALETSAESLVIEREGNGGAQLSGEVGPDELNYIYDEAGGTISIAGEAVTSDENVWISTGIPGISISGSADTVDPYEPTEGTAFFGDSYYEDEYYGDNE